MPSFASDVKNALSRTDTERECCQTAELAALLRMGASMVTDGEHGLGLRFEAASAAVARRVIRLLRTMDTGIETSVAMERTPQLRRRTYIVNITAGEAVTPLLTRLGFLEAGMLRAGTDMELIRKKCCRAAYLRGAFLGGGSVNRPEASCHLEITAKSATMGRALHMLLRRLHFPVGLTDRRDTYVVYLKEGDAVMDFLALIGAEEAAEEIEVARNLKEVRAQVNRLVNVETANLQRAVDAAAQQLAAIERLASTGRLASLSEDLCETAEMRRAHPEVSMAELAALCHISKSGMSHRLRKICRAAEEV
ncbi:DNA-binding protein WhiA [uncultured Selenomonas sp.]|uniref:DNA-binding protein WhiA n=1 Tax=uncultured Selenomonas sp. TaxID=159275 RepID=UPI0028EB3666|nr:DNA-binding protein WhiA [uncultured Selenomonas sp.]